MVGGGKGVIHVAKIQVSGLVCGGYGGGRCVRIVSDVASGGRVWGSRFGRVGWGGDEKNLVDLGRTFTATLSGATQIRVAIVEFSALAPARRICGGGGRVGWGGMAKDFIEF